MYKIVKLVSLFEIIKDFFFFLEYHEMYLEYFISRRKEKYKAFYSYIETEYVTWKSIYSALCDMTG